jgi:hypothetical protein
MPAGKPRHYDMTAGKYDIVVTMGKAFSSKRSESFDMMSQVLQSSPNCSDVIGDIYFRNSDMAGSHQVAERCIKMLPPQLQEDENNPLPPEAQAHIAQAQQQVQEMQGEMQKLQFEKAAKVTEQQGKMQQIQLQGQQDQQLEMMKLENALTIAEVQTNNQNVNERLAAVEDMFKQFHINSHELAMQKDDQAHQQQIAQQQHAQQQELADQQAQNTSAQSAQDAAQGQAAAEAQPE